MHSGTGRIGRGSLYDHAACATKAWAEWTGSRPTLITSIDISSMPKGINACAWRRAGSRSPLFAASIIRLAMISRTVQADPKFRSDLQARSNASPIAEVAASSNQMYWIGVLFIGTSRNVRAGALGRLSVAAARSPFGDEIRIVPQKGED